MKCALHEKTVCKSIQFRKDINFLGIIRQNADDDTRSDVYNVSEPGREPDPVHLKHSNNPTPSKHSDLSPPNNTIPCIQTQVDADAHTQPDS